MRWSLSETTTNRPPNETRTNRRRKKSVLTSKSKMTTPEPYVTWRGQRTNNTVLAAKPMRQRQRLAVLANVHWINWTEKLPVDARF